MANQDLLTLRQAAEYSGRGKKTLQSLVERGALPAVRQDGQWLIARSDLALLYQLDLQTASTTAAASGRDPALVRRTPSKGPALDAAGAVLPAASGRHDATLQDSQALPIQRSEVAMLLKMLRQRDEQIAKLQEDHAQLTGQIGFLQGLLIERDLRSRVLEAARNSVIDAQSSAAVSTPPTDSSPPGFALSLPGLQQAPETPEVPHQHSIPIRPEAAPSVLPNGATLPDQPAAFSPPIARDTAPAVGSGTARSRSQRLIRQLLDRLR